MDDQRDTVTLAGLSRWLLAAAVILVGLVLYFRFAGTVEPVAPPAVQETSR